MKATPTMPARADYSSERPLALMTETFHKSKIIALKSLLRAQMNFWSAHSGPVPVPLPVPVPEGHPRIAQGFNLGGPGPMRPSPGGTTEIPAGKWPSQKLIPAQPLPVSNAAALRKNPWLIAIFLSLASCLLPPANAQQAFIVTSTSDSGPGSLRQAIL